MSVIELKAQLISKIGAEEREDVLQEWLQLMEQNDKVFELPDELLEGLDEIEAEMDRGEYHTHEEVIEHTRLLLEDLQKKYNGHER